MKKNILLGVCGGIAAYKSATIASSLVQKGYNVQVVMTENAKKFITPLTLETVSKNKVITNLWDTSHKDVEHIKVARSVDLVLIAPATYNTISKIASGIADDALTTIVSATSAPVYFALAMNNIMYSNPILRQNINKLKKYNYKFIESDEGFLACTDNAKGRLKNENEIINIIINELTSDLPLKGIKILITASRTEEVLDPIRYFSNKSSGKMGFSLAKEAIKLGAKVLVVTGPTNEDTNGIETINIRTALEMNTEVLAHYKDFDIIIGASAVADYRPEKVFTNKIKKRNQETLEIKLIKNPDIIKTVGENKLKDQIVIGFCAEDTNLLEKAKEKLKNKNLDYIIANDLSYFSKDENKVYIIDKNLNIKELKEMQKSMVASEIIKLLTNNL